jgi:AraC-like DNA-binding protein
MEYAVRAPHPALREHVRRYTGYAEDGAPVRRREVVNGRVVLIVSFGPPLRLESLGSFGSFLVGMHAPVTITEHDGVSRGVQLDLTPMAARMLLGVPMHELAGRVVDLGDVLAEPLDERLAGARSWEERFGILDAALGRRLLAAPQPPPDVARAWSRLEHARGRLTVAELAAELGCSRRHLAARFRDHVGVGPKAAARVMRFHHAMERLGEGADRWPDVALDCGYYDQPHMNREFRELAGAPPGELFPFVQDGAVRAA